MFWISRSCQHFSLSNIFNINCNDKNNCTELKYHSERTSIRSKLPYLVFTFSIAWNYAELYLIDCILFHPHDLSSFWTWTIMCSVIVSLSYNSRPEYCLVHSYMMDYIPCINFILHLYSSLRSLSFKYNFFWSLCHFDLEIANAVKKKGLSVSETI